MARYCFINGVETPVTEAFIHITDLGLLRSYAVFDYLRTYNGKPFRLKDHLERFRNSASELTLPLNYSDDEIRDTITGLIAKSDVAEAGIRLVLTGGYSLDSMTLGDPNFLIVIEKLPEYPETLYEKGVKLMTHEYQRDVPMIKSTGYLNAILLQPEKEKQQAFDILYCHKGEVLEVTRNNFFIFKDGSLITPKENVLLGITRKVVLELADGHFPLEERTVAISELIAADEAFLCGTTKKIIPVVMIDDFTIGNGRVGPHTRKLMELFDAYVSRN